jgi:hypothetical protein
MNEHDEGIPDRADIPGAGPSDTGPSDTGPSDTGESLGSPDPARGGPTIDDAVDNAEGGSQVEGVHTPSGEAESGESRVEQMPEVEGLTEHGRVDRNEAADSAGRGPQPDEIGSGGAQRIEGARISDRVAGGESAPDGPPFE